MIKMSRNMACPPSPRGGSKSLASREKPTQHADIYITYFLQRSSMAGTRRCDLQLRGIRGGVSADAEGEGRNRCKYERPVAGGTGRGTLPGPLKVPPRAAGDCASRAAPCGPRAPIRYRISSSCATGRRARCPGSRPWRGETRGYVGARGRYSPARVLPAS